MHCSDALILLCKIVLKVISRSLCLCCGGLSMPVLCYCWSATSEAGPMAGAVWFWLRSSRQRQCQSGREVRARLQRCVGGPVGSSVSSSIALCLKVVCVLCLLVVLLNFPFLFFVSDSARVTLQSHLQSLLFLSSHSPSLTRFLHVCKTYKHSTNPSWPPSLDEHQLSNATPYFVLSFFGSAINASI